MEPKRVQHNFFNRYKFSRLYLEWTKSLDDYGVLWVDATRPTDVMPRLEINGLSAEMFLLGPDQSVREQATFFPIERTKDSVVYVGDHDGRVYLLCNDNTLVDGEVLWCDQCQRSFIGARSKFTCGLCSCWDIWVTEQSRLSWFGYVGEVRYHPIWRSRKEASGNTALYAPLPKASQAAPVAFDSDEFSATDLFDANEAVQAGERESGKWEKLKAALSGKARVHGWPMAEAVEELARLYPNFEEVCRFIVQEIKLAPHRRDATSRLPNLLVVGGPSCGKSSFLRRLAQIFAPGDWERVDFGQGPTGFELVGSDSGFSKAKEGRVLRLMASRGKGPVRNPVMILDELDKLRDNSQYSPLPALLSLLEKNDAVRFRDAFFGICVDASAIQFLATANDRYQIPAPLLSRFELFSIADYSPQEFTDVVVPNIYREWADQFHEGTFPAELSDRTRHEIAAAADFIPRRVHAVLVRLAAGGWREFQPKPTFETLNAERSENEHPHLR